MSSFFCPPSLSYPRIFLSSICHPSSVLPHCPIHVSFCLQYDVLLLSSLLVLSTHLHVLLLSSLLVLSIYLSKLLLSLHTQQETKANTVGDWYEGAVESVKSEVGPDPSLMATCLPEGGLLEPAGQGPVRGHQKMGRWGQAVNHAVRAGRQQMGRWQDTVSKETSFSIHKVESGQSEICTDCLIPVPAVFPDC